MLDKLEKVLNNKGIFEDNIPEILQQLANSIPSTSIPYKMKLTLAVSELMLFISQFRCNIKHWNNSSIPINAITFCIAKSGASKDSSAKAVRKCFTSTYDLLNSHRKIKAKEVAINKAKEAYPTGNCDLWAVYKEFYVSPNPLFVAPSTVEGFVQHLNDLEESKLGSGYIFSGEIGAELASSNVLVDNLKILAELYDEGTKEVKILKDRTLQSKEIKNLPVSALFLGSQDNILFDDAIKRKFCTEFTTKLARRSFFVFVNEDIEDIFNGSIEDMLLKEKEIEDTASIITNNNSIYILDTVSFLFDSNFKHITVDEEVRNLFILYKKYNEESSKIIDNQYPIAKLTRSHLQWKALKLAGALALINKQTSITIENYKGAISFVELINKDILKFEQELVKEPYELFASYCNNNCINKTLFIGLHMLRKIGYIPMKGNPTLKIKELLQLVQSYDSLGIYKYIQHPNEGIIYEKFDKKETIIVSYLNVSGSKEQRVKICNKGYITEEIKFSELKDMLNIDVAYTPFKFTGGIRGKDRIESGCKWIVLDVDTSTITDEETDLLLSDLNHYIIRTSDATNQFKFRVIIELDIEVNIPDIHWNLFINNIAQDLGLEIDILPKSQIFFNYASSSNSLLYNVTGEPLKIKEYLINLDTLQKNTIKSYSEKEKNELLQDMINTFYRAYNAKDGEGSRKLIWAAKYAKSLGADKEYILNLINDINDYWVNPMNRIRLQNTILTQIDRWVF